MARNDVAIYLPATAGLYNRNVQRASGAERQMVLLAQALCDRGFRVAQIVYPVSDPVALPPLLTLVERPRHQIAGRSWLGPFLEALETWRAVARADARIVLLRKRTAALAIAALFCRLHRRRLIFSSANDYEFLHEHFPDGRPRRALYSFGVRSADVVVVQSERQLALARRTYPNLRRLVRVPSFVDGVPLAPSTRIEARAFLWVGRIVDYKQPLRYIELARAFPEAVFLMVPIVDVSEPDSPLLPEVHAAPDTTPNLRLLDPLPHAALLDLIRTSVAVVNTSRFEGMPNVFLEAWASGVPALTLEFDPDGVIARHGLGIAAEGSWQRFVAGARQMWAGRSDREQWAQRTRAYVDRVHSYDAVGRRWQELVADVLGGASEPGPA